MTTSEHRGEPRTPSPAARATTPSPENRPTTGQHPDIPVVGPLAGSFTWDPESDRWDWSDEMYVIHGFAPHEVVPTLDLLLAHKHPDDRARAEDALRRFLSTGERYACYHRIIDARSRQRHVLVVASGLTDDAGAVSEMSGFMIDLTSARQHDIEPAIREALDGALSHRSEIDLAKGALMLGCSSDPDEAFEILRTASNRNNLKLAEVAHRIVVELGQLDGHASPESIPAILHRVVQPDYVPPDV